MKKLNKKQTRLGTKPPSETYRYSGRVHCTLRNSTAIEGVKGVTVRIEGSSSSVITGTDGRFSLTLAQQLFESENGALIIYSKGIHSERYRIGEKGSPNQIPLLFKQAYCNELQ